MTPDPKPTFASEPTSPAEHEVPDAAHRFEPITGVELVEYVTALIHRSLTDSQDLAPHLAFPVFSLTFRLDLRIYPHSTGSVTESLEHSYASRNPETSLPVEPKGNPLDITFDHATDVVRTPGDFRESLEGAEVKVYRQPGGGEVSVKLPSSAQHANPQDPAETPPAGEATESDGLPLGGTMPPRPVPEPEPPKSPPEPSVPEPAKDIDALKQSGLLRALDKEDSSLGRLPGVPETQTPPEETPVRYSHFHKDRSAVSPEPAKKDAPTTAAGSDVVDGRSKWPDRERFGQAHPEKDPVTPNPSKPAVARKPSLEKIAQESKPSPAPSKPATVRRTQPVEPTEK